MHVVRPQLEDAQDLIRGRVFGGRGQADSGLGSPDAWETWTPSFTNLTNVGSPTITGRWLRDVGRVYVQVKIVPGTTSASTAGSTYFALPVPAAGLAGDGSMQDSTTQISIGDCVIDVANSRCYTPTQAATGDTMLIAGWYEG